MKYHRVGLLLCLYFTWKMADREILSFILINNNVSWQINSTWLNALVSGHKTRNFCHNSLWFVSPMPFDFMAQYSIFCAQPESHPTPPSLPGDGAIRQHPYCKYERMFWECFQIVSEQRNEKWIFKVQSKGNKWGGSKPRFNGGGGLFFTELVKLWESGFSDWKSTCLFWKPVYDLCVALESPFTGRLLDTPSELC